MDSKNKPRIRIIDLFAGMGGIRRGFTEAASALGFEVDCVMTSELKKAAIQVLQDNYPDEEIKGDIREIASSEVSDFDVLLGGFPCQAFSSAGKRSGFADTRGTLFFEIERLLRDKRPKAFLLENVEGLVGHDRDDKASPIGRTLRTILARLEDLGYTSSWAVLNASDFGIPQDRRRIYIVGHLGDEPIFMPNPLGTRPRLASILEEGLPTEDSPFVRSLLKHFKPEELYGKSIKDKRGGTNNIHSWEIGQKGEVSREEAEFLNLLLKERRKKKWAEDYGIDWMDGMSLSYEQIRSFYPREELEDMLARLTKLGYLKREHPKRRYAREEEGGLVYYRKQDPSLPLGYNIVSGKLSFPISKILDPEGIAPTLVATDMSKLYVVDRGGLRRLSIREGLRLCGYPEDYVCHVKESEAYDLLGNTVVVPVIRAVAEMLIATVYQKQPKS